MGHHGTMTARRKNLTIWPGLGLLGCDLVLPENAQPVPDKQEGHVHLEDFAVELPLHTHKGKLTGCLKRTPQELTMDHRNTLAVIPASRQRGFFRI